MTNDVVDCVFPLKGGEVISDSFDTPTIDPAWVRIDGPTSTHTTWTQQQGVMSASHFTGTGDSPSGNIHALMRPITDGATYPYTIESFIQHLQVRSTTYIMVGLVMANGATRASGLQEYAMYYPASTGMASQCTIHSIQGYTAYDSGGGSVGSMYAGSMYAGLHHRLIWEDANKFRAQMSTDGINWIGTGLHSRTMSVTHIGLAICNWNTSVQGALSAYYFRAYESADPQFSSDTL